MTKVTMILPLPVSVNASHSLSRGKRGVIRSAEYTSWIDSASRAYRKQFPQGFHPTLTGRISVTYVFCWPNGSRGAATSDISNREKVLSDFLQKKIFENDKQIDEQHHYRRITSCGESCVHICVKEIPECRHLDPLDIINLT